MINKNTTKLFDGDSIVREKAIQRPVRTFKSKRSTTANCEARKSIYLPQVALAVKMHAITKVNMERERRDRESD